MVVYVKTKTRTQKNVVLANYTPKDIKNVTNQILISYIIMNTGQRIFTKLFKDEKTELNTHEIKLGVADDINKSIQNGENAISELKKALQEAEQIKKDFAKMEQTALKHRAKSEKTAAKFEKITDKIESTLNKAEKQADDLGVPASAIKNFDKAMSIATDVFDLADDLKRFDYNLGQ